MASGYAVAGTDLDSLLAPLHTGWPQASQTHYAVQGTDLDARYAPLSTGSAPNSTHYAVQGTDLSQIFAAAGSTGVQVATQPSNVSGSAAAGNPSGTVTSGVASCAGIKGGGSYTYNWVCNGCTANSPTSSSTSFSATVNAGSTSTPTAYCTISDGVTSVNTASITASLTNTTPAFTSAQHTYSATSGTETVPTGATQVVIELWGLGGQGAYGTGSVAQHNATYGAGAQAAGYCRSVYPCSGGQTLNYDLTTVYQQDSSVTSGTLSITTMTAVGGGEAGVTGYGTASGGNQANVTGALGGPGGSTLADGAGGAGTVGVYEGAEGGGGNGGYGAVQGAPGGPAFVSFYYT